LPIWRSLEAKTITTTTMTLAVTYWPNLWHDRSMLFQNGPTVIPVLRMTGKTLMVLVIFHVTMTQLVPMPMTMETEDGIWEGFMRLRVTFVDAR
jgi:hypothetical protein